MYYSTTFPCCVVRIIAGMTTWSLDELLSSPTKHSWLQPLMWDAPVQPSSHVQTPERRLRCFLRVYRNTVTSVTSFLSRAPSQGRIYSPRSPKVFPVYAFSSHGEESFCVYYCCSSCRWDSCPSAQSGASYSLHEISLCHLMYSGSLQHYVLASQTQKNEAAETFFDCDWGSVVFSKTEAVNTAEHYNLYVPQTSLESFYKNRHSELLYSDIADFLIVFFTLILCDMLLFVSISKG